MYKMYIFIYIMNAVYNLACWEEVSSTHIYKIKVCECSLFTCRQLLTAELK